MRTLALVTILAACPAIALPQQSSRQSRAQQVAAAFSKHKHVVAEKRGVRREKYKDVRTEPLVKQDISQYSGVYEVVDFGDEIDLRIVGATVLQEVDEYLGSVRVFLREMGDGFDVFEEEVDPLDAERDAPAEIAGPIDADRPGACKAQFSLSHR